MTAERSALAMIETGEGAQAMHRGLWHDAARRLIRNRLAVVAAALILVFTVIAAAAPLAATHDPDDTNFGAGQQYLGSSADHWLGTDGAGRDWYSKLVYGARTSLQIGVLSQLIVLAIGVPVGLLAGYVGRQSDNLLMRITDLMYAFPVLLFIILWTQWRGPSVTNIYIAIGLVSWTDVARLVRGQVLALRKSEFVVAAEALGARPWRVMVRHLLPNTLGPVIIALTFGIPNAIFFEATLSFLGVGLPSDVPSLGKMVSDGYAAIFGQQILVIAPATAIAVILLAFTFLGDGLRDALDPRTR